MNHIGDFQRSAKGTELDPLSVFLSDIGASPGMKSAKEELTTKQQQVDFVQRCVKGLWDCGYRTLQIGLVHV